MARMERDCEGCGHPGATETLWLDAPLGMCAVHVHRDRGCAELGRQSFGGGKFRADGPPLSKKEKAELETKRKLQEAKAA